MRTNLVWALAVVLTALLEAKWPYLLRVQSVVPQLVLVLVVYFAITEGEERAMFTGLLGGLFKDVATDAAVGHSVLCLVIVGYFMGTAAKRLITDNPAVKAGAVFCASVTYGLLYIAVDYLQRTEGGGASMLFTALLPQAFYTALATPLLFLIMAFSPMPQQRRAL